MLGGGYLGGIYPGGIGPTAGTSARVSQAAIEILSAPAATAAAAQVTQTAPEILTGAPPPAARITAAALEVLTAGPVPGRITQDAIEVLGPSPAGARATAYAVEVLTQRTTPARVTQLVIEWLGISIMPVSGDWKVLIDGEERTPIVDAFSMSSQLNDRARATVVLADFLPTRFDELVSYDGQTPIFGGVILQRAFQGRNQYDPTFTLTVECGDWFTYADWCYTTVSYDVPVTLIDVLTDLVNDHLTNYGIALDPAQVIGPTLSPFTWTNKRVSDALRELSDRTGYVVRIAPAKLLSMFVPGTIAAPVSLTEATPNCHDLTWRDADRIPYNRVTVSCGPNGQAEVADEKHYGDGTRRRWPLNAPFVAIIGALRTGNDTTGLDDGGYNVGVIEDDGAGAYPWMVERATNEVVQRADQPILAADQYFVIWYQGQFPFTVSSETGARPIVEYVETRPDVMSIPVGQEIADQLLASSQAAGRDIQVTTDVDGFDPGQALDVELEITRAISGSFLVTAVGMQIVLDTTQGDRFWQYRLDAIESALYQGNYLDGWRQLTGGGSGTTVVSGGGGDGGGTAGGGAATPVYLGGSRQFSLEPSPAVWLPVPEYVPFVAGADFSGRVRADVFARRAGVAVMTRLFNVTDNVPVQNGPAITSTTAVPITFDVSIFAGKTYRLEAMASAAGEGVFAIGSLEAV